MKYEFDFKMDEQTLGDFYKSHNKSGFGGILWPMLGVFAILLAVISSEAPVSYRILYVIFGLLFFFYIPWDLKKKAKKQVQKNPYYAEPIHYVMDEKGVSTTQGERTASVSWEDFTKVKLTKKSMILYMRNQNACVVALSVFGEDLEKACAWVQEKVSHKNLNK